MPIYGDLPWCSYGSCQWYTLNMELKKHSDRVSCPLSLDPNNMVINFVGAQSFTNVTNFDEPWTVNESTESITLSTTLLKRVNFKYQQNRLATSARRMLFEVTENVSSRLVYHSSTYNYNIITTNENLLDDV